MAGRGPAPKPADQRRRYNQPARGEWVDLEPLPEPVLPGYDEMHFTVAVWMWQAWRESPVTSQYGPEDIAAIKDLAIGWEEMTFADRDRRMDRLGLTPKGKRDLRWRTPNEVKTIKAAEEKAKITRLHAVAKDEPA